MLNAERMDALRRCAMTDRDLMLERIQNAMQALDRAHAAGSELRNDVNAQNLEAFRAHMRDLCGELETLKHALENQALYGQDEMINLFSELFSGQPTPYRHVAEARLKKQTG
jgi:hypothetical protein